MLTALTICQMSQSVHPRAGLGQVIVTANSLTELRLLLGCPIEARTSVPPWLVTIATGDPTASKARIDRDSCLPKHRQDIKRGRARSKIASSLDKVRVSEKVPDAL